MLHESETPARFLKEELGRRMRANPRYSQRAFARQLGLSPGELSEVLQGKRSLSLRSGLKVAQALSLTEEETRQLLLLSQAERSRRLSGGALPVPAPAETARPQQLTLDMFQVVSDWACFAILNLADCTDFDASPAAIAERLGIPRLQAELAIERLERVGLIERRGKTFRATPDYVLSPSGIPSEAIRSHHRQILAKAAEALDAQGVNERDITGVGLAVDPRHLPALKREIADFQDRMIRKFSKGRRTEVYQLEVALFRLTQRRTKS